MKLARLLDVEVGELGYLEGIDPVQLRRLRELATEALFDSGGAALGRLALGSRLLPTGVIASIAQHAFGPVLAARIAGLLDPGRAADVAAKLPTEFLAQIAIHLDPRRAADVLARIPAQRIADVARELVALDEHVTLGRFVGHLSDEAVALSVREMDDFTVVSVGFVLEDLSAITRVLELIDQGRLDGLVEAATGTELWPEVLDLYDNLPAPLRARVLGTRTAEPA